MSPLLQSIVRFEQAAGITGNALQYFMAPLTLLQPIDNGIVRFEQAAVSAGITRQCIAIQGQMTMGLLAPGARLNTRLFSSCKPSVKGF